MNGRKIIFLSYDDAYSLPKTVEQTRELVEQDGVLLSLNPLGIYPNDDFGKDYLKGLKDGLGDKVKSMGGGRGVL